jgi:hypothetical protein
MMPSANTEPCKNYRFSPAMISRTVWLYSRFRLCYRDVAEFVSSPILELLPGHHGQTAPPEIPSDQAVCDPSADADHAWHATDTTAA